MVTEEPEGTSADPIDVLPATTSGLDPLAVTARAEASLEGIVSDDFTPGAISEAQLSISTFVRSLIAESARTADRRQHDGVVSAADVKHARQYLSSARERRLTDHLGTLGGVLLGAGLGNLVSLIAAEKLNIAAVIVTLILAVAGVAMVAFQLASDR